MDVPYIMWQDGYNDMFHDNDRNNKYFDAIKLAIATRHKNNQKAIVLDIGTGCGLLAMMAAKAGADQVYACEELPFMFDCAKKVVARNNFSNIKLINKNSKEMSVGRYGDIPAKANILVTEIFGNDFLAEGAIETINHANIYLLTSDCIHIPQKAVLFAQVVDCKLIDNMSSISSISLPNGTEVNFPDSMKTCSNKTNFSLEMQLGALTRDKFSKLSSSLVVFEFRWNEIIPYPAVNSIEFISCGKGNANTIFSWWDLHMDSTEENIISVKPTWAGGSSDNWRYGWMPRIFSGHSTIDLDLQEGTKCFLNAFHDDTNMWYKIVKASVFSDQDNIIEPFSNSCYCLMHDLIDSYQIAEANNVAKIEKYEMILREHIIPDKTTVLVLSEPGGTILHLLAAGLGAKKVFLLPTHRQDEKYYRDITSMVISYNQFEEKIHLLPSTAQNLNKSDFDNYKIDLIIGDPFFGKESCKKIKIDPFNYLLPYHSPFHHLLFWKYLSLLKYDLGVLSVKCPISPATAVIKAIAMKFDCSLARINCPIDTVCGEQFSIRDFSNLFQLPGNQLLSSMNYQYLSQYPGIAVSGVINLLNFDFSKKIPRDGQMKNSGELILKKPADGFVVWIEWQTGDNTFSSGPTETPNVDRPVVWENYKKQGIHYNYNLWNKRIKWSISYDYQYNKLFSTAQ